MTNLSNFGHLNQPNIYINIGNGEAFERKACSEIISIAFKCFSIAYAPLKPAKYISNFGHKEEVVQVREE